MRKARYDFDQALVAPYFEMDRVLTDGVFFAATQLYGITFKERTDLPRYHDDVRIFEVSDADGAPLALFIARLLRPRQQAGRGLDGSLRHAVKTAAALCRWSPII